MEPHGNPQGLQPARAGSSWALPVHPAVGQQSPTEPKLFPPAPPGSGGAQGTSAPALAQRRHQEPPTGTTHIPRLPPLPLFTPSMVLGTKSHLPPLLLSWRSPCPGLCQPGLAAHSPLGACSGLLWQPLPTALCQRLPGASCALLSHTAPVYSWQLPGQG